ncbi:zinc finger BED domain-containing protein RICESLEEPER 2 [Tanacetum coccineum]
MFLVLSRMAMDILSVQATSVAYEYAFSTSGRVLSFHYPTKKLHLMLLVANVLCPEPVLEEKRLRLIIVMVSIMMITNCRL